MTISAPTQSPDRYVSFLGMDCDGQAERFVSALRKALEPADNTDPFWNYFRSKLDGERGPAHDALYHIHCHINDLRDLLERTAQPVLSELLDALEHECC